MPIPILKSNTKYDNSALKCEKNFSKNVIWSDNQQHFRSYRFLYHFQYRAGANSFKKRQSYVLN